MHDPAPSAEVNRARHVVERAGASAPADPRPNYPELFRLAFPATFASISVPLLVGIVNTAVIGALGDPNLIGGVAIATIVFNVVFFALNFFRAGTVGLTAQAVGERNEVEDLAVVLRGCAIAFACGLFLLALRPFIGGIGIAAMGAEGEVASAAHLYFDLRIYSAPFMLVNFVVLGWVLGLGKPLLALALEALLNGLNIALSIHFTNSLSLGVEGVALATVLSEVVVTLLGFALIARRVVRGPRPSWSRIVDRTETLRMIRLNSDILLRSLTLFLVAALFVRQGAAFGPLILAANAILLSLFQFSGAFLDGVSTAAEQMSGRAVGARDRASFERVVRMALTCSLLLALLLSTAVFTLGPAMIDAMTTAEEVRATARDYLPWVGLALLLIAVSFQMDGVFIGATWSRDIRNMMLVSALVFLGAVAVLPSLAGNHGLWASYMIFQAARSVAFYLRMRALVPVTFAPVRDRLSSHPTTIGAVP